MRVVEQLHRPGNRREGRPSDSICCHQPEPRIAAERRRHAWQRARPLLHSLALGGAVTGRPPGRRGRTPRTARCHCVSVTAPINTCPVGRVEDVVDRPGRRALGCIGAASLPVTANCAMCWATSSTLFSNRPDCTCRPRPVAWRSCSAARIADRAEHAAHDVVDRTAGAQRPARQAGHVGEPAHHLHHLVERHAVLVGAGQEALAGAIDQARVERVHRFPTQAELVHRAGAEVLDQARRR